MWTCDTRGGISRWALATGAHEFDIVAEHAHMLTCFALSGDSRFAVTGAKDSTLFVWDLKKKELTGQYSGHKGAPLCVAITPDDQYVLSGTSRPDAQVRVFDLKTGRLRHEFPPHAGAVRSVAVSHSGRFAASASDDRSVRLYDLENLREVGRIEAFDDSVYSARFSPDDRHLLAGGKEMVAKLFRLPDLTG